MVERPRPAPEPSFPHLYYTERLERLAAEEGARTCWAPTVLELDTAARHIDDYRSLLLYDDVLAFYGHPLSKRMGILVFIDHQIGRYGVVDSLKRMLPYESRGCVPAFAPSVRNIVSVIIPILLGMQRSPQ